MGDNMKPPRMIDSPGMKCGITSILALSMTGLLAGEAVEAEALSIQEQAAAGMEDADVTALANMAGRAGITLTPETIKRMLEVHPEVLDAAEPNEHNANRLRAAAIFPARFEVTGLAKIYEDTSLTTKNAGGRFTSGGIDVLLNYTSILGGISYENMAFLGSSHSNDIEAKLAVDAEFEAFGVYGWADAGPPPFPAVTYGVYGTTNRINGYGVYAINTAPRGNLATTGGGTALFATGDIDGGRTSGAFGHIDNHVAIIENQSTGTTHVLALSMPYDSSPSAADNFVTFYHGGGTAADAVGAIEGTATGVNYKSGSADFAEWLPRKDLAEPISAGDIVGIVAGKVTRDLENADFVKAISTAPAFTGNDPGDSKRNLYALVSLIGQVPVKVSGAVRAGDYIVASGKNDGTGIAIPENRMSPEHFRLMVGRAWESSDEPGTKLINTAIGLAAGEAITYMQQQDRRIASLENQLSAKTMQLERAGRATGAAHPSGGSHPV